MRYAFVVSVAATLALAVPLGAQQSWTGQISDSMCKAKHEEAAEGQGRMADRDCTLSCVRGGSKFVLLVDGKVLQIANQDNKDLATYAGQTVKMSGELKGDAITVATIEAASAKK
jgi:hypothetical protein